MSDISDFDIEE
jgi:hypothetical protein